MPKLKVIISGGGTGGHIYPAIAIADILKDANLIDTVHFVGALGKMEMDYIPAVGYTITGLWISGLQRKKIWKNVVLPLKIAISLWKAKIMLQKFCPDVVIGTGGYASAPVLYVAAKMGIPTLIQEQNAFAGLTNRILGRYVDKICVAYAGMEQFFPKKKIIVTGNPVRQHIINSTNKKQQAYTYFQLTPQKKCLVVLGGSLGAYTINQSILEGLDQFIAADIQIIWQTGKAHFAKINNEIKNKEEIKLYSFIEKMDLVYAIADVVVARAGALTITELVLTKKPTILVPSPYVADDHQTKNAVHLLDKQAAVLVPDASALENLVTKTIQLMYDEVRKKKMIEEMEKLAKPYATDSIIEAILTIKQSVKFKIY